MEGQTRCTFASGITSGLIVFVPVCGSIPITRFCKPESTEKAYLPVAPSTASNKAGLPAVTTSFRVTPPIGSWINC
jgi:hypothetical protein